MFDAVSVREVRDLQTTLRQQVRRLRPLDVALSDAPPMWEAYDRIERLAASAKMLLEDRVEESRAWAREGDRSPADHLARKSGRSRGAARRSVATSKKLRRLPRTQEALRRGQLSRPQAEEIANAAANNPDAEQSLLEAAKTHSLAELRRRCGQARAAGDPNRDATHRRIHRERYLHRFTDSEGAWNIRGCGTPEAGALFNTILDPIVNEIFQTARREGRREPRSAYEFDGLIELARRAGTTPTVAHSAHRASRHSASRHVPNDSTADTAAASRMTALRSPSATRNDRPGASVPDGAAEAGLDDGATGDAEQAESTRADTARFEAAQAAAALAGVGGADTDGGTDTDGGGPSSGTHHPGHQPPPGEHRARPTDPRHLALLRIDLEALVRGYTEGDELVEITGVGPIPVRVARDLLGDSILKLVITKGVDVVNVTHLGRGPTAAQRVAALWTSPFCTNLGCPNTVQIQHDHRRPWSEVKETVLGNLDRLCPRCHYLKTHKGWALAPGKGRRPLVAPHDPRHPDNRTPASALAPTDAATGASVPADAPASATVFPPDDDRAVDPPPDSSDRSEGLSNRPPPAPSLFDDAA